MFHKIACNEIAEWLFSTIWIDDLSFRINGVLFSHIGQIPQLLQQMYCYPFTVPYRQHKSDNPCQRASEKSKKKLTQVRTACIIGDLIDF